MTVPAIGFEKAHAGGTAKADPGTAWNGPRELAAAPNDATRLRRMHTWRDAAGDPAAKSSYKLPHHTAAGTVVLRGVRAALGALAGARGGVAIPPADRAGVRAHLEKHLREFDVEVPDQVAQALDRVQKGEAADPLDGIQAAAWADGAEVVPWRAVFDVKKSDEEEGLAFGWASVSERADGLFVFDLEDEGATIEELEKGAYGFVLEARVASDRHDETTIGVGNLVESMVFTKEKLEVLGIQEGTVPLGWWVGFQTDDPDMRKALRDGDRRMFSIGGLAIRTEVEE